MLSNLVANAVRYTEHDHIVVGCRRRPDAVEIQVLDTGIGIAEDQRAKIFEEFYQVGNVVRDREHGLGLGLSIVQRSVALLRGTIQVTSVPGHGSKFSVVLPRAAALASASAAGYAASPDRRQRILVIDDNAEVRESMQQLLVEWGHAVVTAGSLAEAIDATATHNGIDLIIADYRLAENITGADAIRAVIAKLNRNVRAVIITGDTSPDRIREAQASGFQLLHKPLDTRQLRDLV